MVSVRWRSFGSSQRRHNRSAALSPNIGGIMSEPWPQDEPENKEVAPVEDEPERQSETAVPELDDDWED
jgi:hypothetical protein